MSQIFIALPKLKEITAANVAFALWNHIDIHNVVEWDSHKDYSSSLNTFEPEVKQFLKDILLPKLVAELINRYIIKISSEMTKWISCHKQKIRLVQNNHWLRHLNEIIWYPNCTINYKKTAINLQNSKFLNEVEKFQFLCLYCLKNEIEQKRKSFGHNFFKKVFFALHPMLFYWDRYCRNRLQDIPVTRGMSIDEFMFRHTKVDIWPAKEYFFDRMNVDEQIQSTIRIIDDSYVKYQKLIIVKLNHFQRKTLYMNRSRQILTNYLLNSEYFDDILPTWFEAAHLISNEDFAIFLRRLILRNFNDRIIAEIWISASETLKLYVLKNESEVTASKIWDLWLQTYDKNTINMLLDTDLKIIEEIKNMAVFSNHCEYLLANNKLLMLEKVLNLCFKSDEKLAPIKQKLAQRGSFSKFCECLILENDFFALKQLFNLFSGVVDLDPIKKNIVTKNFFKDHCKNLAQGGEIPVLDQLLNMFCSSKIEELEKSIRDRFGSVSIIDCSRKLIMEEKLPAIATLLEFFRFGFEHSVRFKFFVDYCEKLRKRNELSKLENLSESLFPSDEEFITFRRGFCRKEIFVDHCQSLIISGQLSELDELLNSIFLNVEESVQYKQDLSTKQFFINHCIELMLEDELQSLGRLFVWIYPYIEESVQFRRALSKNKVFDDHCKKLITNGQLLKLDQLLNLLFLSVEKSVQFKQDLSTEEFFLNHFLKLMLEGELQKLGTLFVWFYPCIEELVAFQRAVSQKKFFGDLCKKLITSGQLSKLDELLNFIFPSVEKSVHFKQDLSTKRFFINHYLKLIIEGELQILGSLFEWFYPCIEELVLFKRAFSQKKTFGDLCQRLITSGQVLKLNEAMNLIFPSVEESVQFKQDLSTEDFSINHCMKLMLEGELQRLRALFVWFYPCIEESVPFRRALSKEKGFGDHCQKLITSGQLSELDETLNLIFPSVEESVQFKQDLSTKKFFIDHCLKLLVNNNLQRLKTLFLLVFPCIEKSIPLKQRLRKKNVFSDRCRSLIIDNQLSKLDELLDLFYSSAEEIATFKKKFVEKNWFVNHCQKLINFYQFTILDELVTWCFSDDVELNRFKSNLAFSNFIEEKCLFFYRTENIESLNNLLNLLFRHRYESIYEYKQNLLFSEDGVKVCFFLANQSNSVLDDMIIDCLPASASIADFKKNLIFSSVAISNLKKMIQENQLVDVKRYFDQFLASAEDRKSLKRHLLDDPKELITLLFFKYERSACESEMEWWFEDETAVHQCKSILSVDAVFMAGLKECVFKTFNRSGRVSRCILKENFDLGSLDRFLSWYFESSIEIKEFKVQKIKSYEDIDTISLLLKKGCRYSYFKELFNWFFENDVAEMKKFKRKHKGEKITSEINIVLMN